MTSKIKNVQELKQELLRISKDERNREYDIRLMALALAYLLSELCPTDRTTKHVEKRAKGNEDAKTS